MLSLRQEDEEEVKATVRGLFDKRRANEDNDALSQILVVSVLESKLSDRHSGRYVRCASNLT